MKAIRRWSEEMMSDRLRDLNERITALLRKGSPIPDAVRPSPASSVDVLEERVIENPTAAGDKLQAQQNALAEKLSEPPMVSTNTELSPPTFLDEVSAEQTPVDVPADEGNRAEQAKPSLAGLDLDTAIRLRWVLRDIRGKRTKLSPISQKDLMALIGLGLIEMENDEPALTNEGMRALAHSTGPTGPNDGERSE
jgi:hypothetical protein